MVPVELDFIDNSGEGIAQGLFDFLRTCIVATMSHFDMEGGYQASVAFVDEESIRSLNRGYRGVDSVTDVLSFPMDEVDARGVALLGDVVLCAPQARRQAIEYGHSLEREFAYLTVHSVLHLLGFDHEKEDERKTMREIEELVLGELKIFR
ncbi:MAG: rRNA maturation RNase YbeY [Eubacteriaceae bacterium]|nr:rRNA maturation RNase YbeY [Eubacteriaceae bacterium]